MLNMESDYQVVWRLGGWTLTKRGEHETLPKGEKSSCKDQGRPCYFGNHHSIRIEALTALLMKNLRFDSKS